MKGITTELGDLKDWTAYIIDLLSKGKTDVTALKVIVLLAIIVIPGGILLQSSPEVYHGFVTVLSPVTGLFQGLIPPSLAPDARIHTGIPEPDDIPPWLTGPGATILPSVSPSPGPTPGATITPNATVTPDDGQAPTPIPEPKSVPTTVPTPQPANAPAPTPAP